MGPDLRRLLAELHEEGRRHDAAEPEHRRRRRNLEPDAAEWLWWHVQAVAAGRVVEIGTSNGYSTIWLADAVAATNGVLTSVDVDAAAQDVAAAHLLRAELTAELVTADGGAWLSTCSPGSVDVLFLDSDRSRYPAWWPAVQAALRPGGSLVIDNAISHAEEVQPFADLLRAAPGWVTALSPLGKGQLLAVAPS
ncbi:O-methyltransferase [Pseudactinotalea suaedae]|uniref:O-methyltransferase n=1 Tax=Pseudactinotalea suaedae TaxID=1524924 RepID=UPI0012E31C7D|nr:class I SAM-dependent methyltransferase [Pseudactinotalea suaedae]